MTYTIHHKVQDGSDKRELVGTFTWEQMVAENGDEPEFMANLAAAAWIEVTASNQSVDDEPISHAETCDVTSADLTYGPCPVCGKDGEYK